MARMTPDEWRKKKEEEKKQGTVSSPAATPVSSDAATSDTTTSGGTVKRMTPSEWMAKKSSSSVDYWAKASISVLNEIQDKSKNWNYKDEHSAYSSRISELLSQADSYRKQYAGNEDAISYINSIVSALSSGKQNSSSVSQYYSKWSTEDEYNQDIESWKEYTAKSNFDLEAGKVELDNLTAQADDAANLSWQISQLSTNIQTKKNKLRGFGRYDANAIALEKEIAADEKRLSELKKQYADTYGDSTPDQLKAAVTEKTTFYNTARFIQEGQRLANEALNAPDFEEYAAKGAAIENPTQNEAEGAAYIFGWRPGSKEVGNIVTYSRENAAGIAMGGANGSTMVGNALYLQMTDDEVSIYNYYLAKYGKEKAQEYLDSIEATLNQRAGSKMAEGVDGNFAATAFMGAVAGLDQFRAGIVNNFKDGESFIAPSATQYASGEIRENLADDGFKLPDWLGGASIAQVGYDAVTTTANMLPSILVSQIPVVGQAAGALTLGASAAGNAYADMINLGYSPGQARTYSVLVGASEAGLQYLLGGISKLGGKVTSGFIAKAVDKVDNAIAKVAIRVGGSMAGEGLEESLQTVIEPWLKSIATGVDFEAPNIDEVLYSGLLGAVTSLFLEGTGDVVSSSVTATQTNKIYGENAADLINEALEIDPNNELALRLKAKLDKGKSVSGLSLAEIIEQNEAGMAKNDTAAIKEAAKQRLADLGETGNIEAISEALTKQATGERLTVDDRQAIRNSKYGQRVANELNTENIQSGQYSSEWAQQIGTDRINADEYSNLVKAAQIEQNDANVTVDNSVINSKIEPQEAKTEATEPTGKNSLQVEGETARPDNANTQAPINVLADNVVDIDEDQPEKSSITLESAAKAYGKQAGDYVATYNLSSGQDVAKFDDAYRKAYEWGQSDAVPLDVAMSSSLTEYLTEAQREAAYMAGADAKNTLTTERTNAVNQRKNGKKGRRKGTVQGRDVSIADLKKTFNDKQGKAYKILSRIAEVTGIDIVLYRSEANAAGEFTEDQGQFKWGDDKIYIDINAGLETIKDVESFRNYTMLRTFSHEFIHFLEKHNPAEYNELRKAVFDALRERGENVDDLILEKQKLGGKNEDGSYKLSYERASREVVAEAMTDILPDSHFIEQLAEKHKNLFETLLEKLKEFIASIREYFEDIKSNPDTAANALMDEIDGAVRYMESLVTLFDKVAENAVENYQASVAVDEATTVSETKTETKAETKAEAKAETKFEDDGSEFTITDNAEYGSLEIKFDGKPSETVRDVLKANKFRWHKQKQIWYGKADRADIVKALRAAYEAEQQTEAPKTESTVTNISDNNAEIAPETVNTTPETAETVHNDIANDEYESLAKKLNTSYFVKENGLIFAIRGNEKDGYHGFIKRPREKSGAYPVENAFDTIYRSADFKTVKEAVDDIVLIARISELLKSNNETNAEKSIVEEEKENGENVDNQGAVQQSAADGQGASQLLEQVETQNVQGDGSGRNAVADVGERGQQTERNGDRADAERTGGRSSEGDSQSGDLRRDNGLTAEEAEQKAEQLHEQVVEQIAQQSTEKPKGRNFVIGDSLDLPNGEKARYKANIEAIKLVKKLEAEGRHATEAEQAILSKYVGWGGLANAFDERKAEWANEYTELKELLSDEEYKLARGSTLNAHYTDISVIKAMYDGLAQLGFNGGRLLEPSSGVGNFVGAMPTEMSSKVKSWTMVELDGITGLIAKHLYPNADVRIQGFEKANIPDNYMDVAISNVPFGNYPITDKAYPKKVTSAIHNYFFAKSLDKVRPGGIVMFITSSYTMNSKDSTVRRYIMQRADLLGAIRLPDTAFKGNAGTEVVTDILILKKRAANTDYAGVDFLEAPYQYIESYRGANINNYFIEHPEMVLGTATMSGSMYRGDSLTYKAFTDKGSLADQIREAFKNIEGKMDYPAQLSPEKTNFAVERASKKTKEGGYVAKDGKIYKNDNGNLVEQSVNDKTAERIAGMLEIRDAARELQNGLQQGWNEAEIRKARQKLNKAYDAFVKKNGYINSKANKAAIKNDPDSFSIYALENWNSDTKTATKADIFSKNTIAANRTVTSAKDVAEGLIVSINQTGAVDVSLIAKLTGQSEDAVMRELIDSRLAFKNRNGELEAAETYLSGNVRAKLRDAEALVPLDEDYAKNVEALKSVMPEDVGYQDIFVNPGTPWIPNSVYSDFAAHMLGTRNTEWSKAVDVVRNPETGNFTVELQHKYLKSNAANTQKWGTSRRTFLDLFDAMLNSRSVVVKYKTDDGATVIDKDATAAANEKIENITKEFQEWLWQDEARRTELETLYNEVFNSIVTPKYNGDNLTVNGANAMKPLRPHQRNAVQRVISSGGNTLLAHKVGAGKTYEMAAAAMKLKQLGLVNKPLFAVPKPLVAQWGTEFMDFFPTARLLVSDETDFTTANRKTFMNRIANGNYDAVIVSYEQFEKLPMSDEFTVGLYEDEMNTIIRAIEEAKAEKGGKALSVKDLEKKRKSLQAKIDKLTSKPKDEGNINFEELGVDGLFVDEAHSFKNLFYTTSMTNVSGLSNKEGAARSFDLFSKVRYLQQLNGGRGIVFATATPVMNSMSEMYIMQKYLQPDLLEQLGLTTFDAWAKQFGEVVNGIEIKPSGQGYRVKQSFSRFKNMSELQLLFRNFADVLTDIPGLKIPKMKGGKVNVVVCEPGQFQQDFMKELEKRADNIKNVDPTEDNMLKITSDGRKISYTQRMIDPSLPYEEGCKIYRCADNVAQEYNDSKGIKGTQLIFCDMATPKGKSKTADAETVDAEMDMESAQLYDDLKSRLVENGIPAKEIAFIHEADTDQKKKKLFADVNEGKVRVLIGSTGKMGVGMNAQKRVVAIHHLDAPWRPGDVEQRNGRAFRQGNINDEVSCYTYVTEGSFDARLWDILERKQNFINQVMNGENVGRETEDTGEVTLSAAEVKALASGSPLIMEQVQLDTDIKKLESLRRAYTSAVRAAKDNLEIDKGTIATLEKRIAAGKADMAATVDTYSEGKFSITVGKKKFTDKKDAGVALMAEATAKATDDGYITIGSFAGFDLRVVKTHEGIKGLLSGRQGYSFKTYPGNTTFMINHLIATVEGISESVKAWEGGLVETRKDMAEQEKLIAEPFAKQAELDQKRARYNEVMEILNPKEEQALDSADEDIVQSQARAYAKATYKNISQQEYRQIQEDRMAKYGGKFDEAQRIDYTFAHDNLYVFENFDETSFGVIDRIDPAKQPEKADYVMEVFKDGVIGDVQDYRRGITRLRNFQKLRSVHFVDAENRGTSAGNAQLDSAAGGSADGIGVLGTGSSNNDDLNTQSQPRTKTLSDHEVLEMAADEVLINDFTDAEKDAFNIFKKRLARLRDLQEQRAEQGSIYKEQQFGAKPNREEAAKTLNRMQLLDDQIKQANDDLFTIEEKAVLRSVLKKARRVVEQEERAKGEEKLKRWRDRRNNATAIKKYRERIKTDVDTLTNWILHPNNKDITQHVPDVLKNSVIPFLSSIDFTSKQQLRGGEATKADQEFVKQLKSMKAALKQNIDTYGLYSGYTDLPEDFMDSLQTFIETVDELTKNNSGEFIINKMTAEELSELSKVVRTLKKYITQFNRFHYNSMYQYVDQAGDNSIQFMGELDDAGSMTGGVSNFIFWQQIRPAYAFERFGQGGKAIYDGFRRAHATLAFNTKVIEQFANETYTAKEVRAWEDEIKQIELDGDIVKVPVAMLMSFYELSKQPDSLVHILGEGVRVATYTRKGKKISDKGHMLTQGDVETMIATLTDRQKEVADALQKFMAETGGKWGNHVSMKRWGEELFGNPKYFPINSDGRHLQATADENPSAASLYALLNMSFTKERKEGANNRIILYSIFDVFANHMASMAQYNAFALPILDALKWFNYQQKSMPDENGKREVLASVRDQMARAFGTPDETKPGSGKKGYAENFVMNILKAYNGTEAQGSPNDTFMLKMLHRFNVAQVSANLRVLIQQPTAVMRAGEIIDYRSIIKGMKLNPKAIKNNIEEMHKYSGIAVWKSLGFYDINISRGLTEIIKHDTGFVDKVNEIGMKGAETADLLTWAGIWSACKEEVIKKKGIKPTDNGFFEAVTELFEEVIYKTQVVDSVLTKNEYLRDKGYVSRLFGSFMGEPTAAISSVIHAVDNINMDMKRGMTFRQAFKRNGRAFARMAYVYVISSALTAAVQALGDAWRDDDEYETFLEKWLEAFGGNFLDELNPIGKLPIFSEFVDVFKEILSAFGVDTYGNTQETTFGALANYAVKLAEIISDLVDGEDGYTWYAAVYKGLQLVSGATGLPLAAATREVIDAWNNIIGPMAPSLKVKTYDSGDKNEIKYAYQDGYLTAEEATDLLIEKGLVDSENEAYWLVEGWEAGEDYSRYDTILDAVRNGGDFNAAMKELTAHGYTEDQVIAKVKSEIGDWYKEGKVSKQQATEMLTKYCDMDSKEITALVNKWSSKVVTGIDYDDIKDEYLAGNITAQRAIEMRVRYGGETTEKASEIVNKWRAEKETGINYDNLKEVFMDGEITAAEAKTMYVEYGNYTQEEAAEKVSVMAFVKQHPECDGISYSAVKRYSDHCEQVGISAGTFYDAWKYVNKIEGDGTYGNVKRQYVEYILSLNLSSAEKNAMWHALKNSNWTEKDTPFY